MEFEKEIDEYIQKYDQDKELSWLEKALEVAERDGSATHVLFVKGVIGLKETNPEKAEQCFRELLKITPTNRNATTNLCEALLLYKTTEKFEEILTTTDRYLTGVYESDSALYNARSYAYFNLGRYNEALSTAISGIHSNRRNAVSYAYYVLASLKLGIEGIINSALTDYVSKGGSKEDFVKVVTNRLYNIANFLLVERDDDFAETLYKTIIRLDENFGGAQYNLGMYLFSRKRFREAAESWEKALPNITDEFKERAETQIKNVKDLIKNMPERVEKRLTEIGRDENDTKKLTTNDAEQS